MKKNIKGITLIALVITIIVLLILAGVSISMLTGDNGIIAKAIAAKEDSEKASIEEQLELAEMSLKTKKYGEDITDINEYLNEVALTDIDFEKQDNPSQYGDYDAVLLINEKYLYGLKIVNGDIKIEYIGKPGKLAPKIELSEITQTTSTITVKVTTKRNDGGKLEYYIKEQNDEDYDLKKTQENTQYTYEELEQNKTYIIKIVAVASNGETAKIEEEITLGKVADLTKQNTTFAYGPDGWTNGSVTVTASTQITGYTIQTSKDGTIWDNTAKQTFTTNGTMYVRLWDGKNYGGSATANVDKIDTVSPNSFTPTVQYNYVELKDASDEIKTTYNFNGSYEGTSIAQYGYNNDVKAGEIFYITSAYDYTAYGQGKADVGYYQCKADHTNHTSPYYLSGFCEYLGESYTVPSTSVVIIGSTTDKEATDTNASSGIAKYYFSKDNGTTWEPNEGQTSTNYTFNGLTLGASYTYKMKAVDNAGNEVTSSSVTELKDSNETTKNTYKYGGSTSNGIMSTVTYNGNTYNITYADPETKDVIIYNSQETYYTAGITVITRKGYYKFKAATSSSGNAFLYVSSFWDYLGETYLVEQK